MVKDITIFINNFESFLRSFDENCPFSKFGQLEYHQRTIKIRRELGSVKNAINDDKFLGYLYDTLRAWGLGKQGSKLRGFSDFVKSIREKSLELEKFDGLQIDDPNLPVSKISNELATLVDSLNIVDNRSKLVSSTKALHHLLPDLVVPIDRRYTQTFFGWENYQVQNEYKKCFIIAFHTFVEIARTISLKNYLKDGWYTSKTKVIDNAIVGCILFLFNCVSKSNVT